MVRRNKYKVDKLRQKNCEKKKTVSGSEVRQGY
jgi:hypothetical protein